MNRLGRIAVAIVVASLSFGVIAPTAQAACSKVTDPKGDVRLARNAQTGAVVPDPRGDSQLDLVAGQMTNNKSIKGFTATLKVVDLLNGPPNPPATGEWFSFNFTYKGQVYSLAMIGDEVIDGSKSFSIGTTSDTGLYEELTTVKGKYDDKKNTVSWNVPYATFKSATSKAIGPKAVLTKLELVARANHNFVAVTFGRTADDALTTCSYVVGT